MNASPIQCHTWTVGGRLHEVAIQNPERVALIEGVETPSARRRWTYRELADAASATASALLARFAPNEHIAVWAPGTPEWYLLQLGASLAGLVLVPINPGATYSEAEFAVTQSGCVGIFVADEHRGALIGDDADRIAAGHDRVRCVVRFAGWDRFVSTGDPTAKPPDVDPDSPVLIIYTSGTTGTPKGAVLSHRAILLNAEAVVERGAVEPGAVWLNPLPMFHSGGCIFIALGALACAGTMIQLPAFRADLALALIEQERPVVTSTVPTMFLSMMESPRFAETDLSSLAKCFTGASSIPPEMVYHIERAFGLTFVMTYGQTEGGPTISMVRPDDPIDVRANSIGFPLRGYAVRVVDPQTGAPVMTDQIGELLVQSQSTMLGYFERAEETAMVIDEAGWLHTGDLCSLDESGYLHHRGRLKEVIIRGGENVAPREIEDLLFAHPDVVDVAVVGAPDPKYGEKVIAFVRADVGSTAVDEAELIEYCRQKVTRYKVPARIWFVEEFPLTASGKVKKFELRQLHLQREGQQS